MNLTGSFGIESFRQLQNTSWGSNHGLFELERPQWQTVSEGSREYVERVAKEIPRVRTAVDVRSVARAIDGVVVTLNESAEGSHLSRLYAFDVSDPTNVRIASHSHSPALSVGYRF